MIAGTHDRAVVGPALVKSNELSPRSVLRSASQEDPNPVTTLTGVPGRKVLPRFFLPALGSFPVHRICTPSVICLFQNRVAAPQLELPPLAAHTLGVWVVSMQPCAPVATGCVVPAAK